MSTTVFKNRPFYEVEDLIQKLSSLDECEHGLFEQQGGLEAYNDLFEQYQTRLALLQKDESLTSEDLEEVQRIWKRLSTNPTNPARHAETSFIRGSKELRKSSVELWKALSENISKRGQLLEDWYQYIEEISYRLYLLGELGHKIEHFEKQHKPTSTPRLSIEAQAQLQATSKRYVQSIQSTTELLREAYHQALPESTRQCLNPVAEKYTHEQRQCQRIHLGTTVSFGSSEHAFYTGFTENISSGGLFIATYGQLPSIGEHLHVSLILNRRDTIDAECRVAWVREYLESTPEMSPGFGCQLLNLSEEQQSIINRYIAQMGSIFMPTF